MSRSSCKIIHEDRSLLVVDKPSGMPSVSLKGGEARTVASWLLMRFPKQVALPGGGLEAGLVHRLDNETSGVIIAVRTHKAHEDLRRQFGKGSIKKEYTALVIGHPPDTGLIETPIAHHPRKRRKMIVCPSPERALELKARPACTVYRLLERFKFMARKTEIRYALLSVTIKTGVRHQIRVHLASIGHPIAGDKLYQNTQARKRDVLGVRRQFLHAVRISLQHPSEGGPVSFSSPLPDDLEDAISRLEGLCR